MIDFTADFSKGGVQRHLLYPGVVVNNNDPAKRGRCRVKIAGLTDNVPNSDLPWARNELMSHSQGASSVSGSFSVPRRGSKVNVAFREGDPYTPAMVSYDVTSDTLLPEASEDYPDTHVLFRYDSGTKLVYNVLRRVMTWFNNQDWKGTNARDLELTNSRDIKATNGRDINVVNAGKVTVQSASNIDVNCDTIITIKAGATVTIRAEASITIQSPITTVTGNLAVGGALAVAQGLSVAGGGGSSSTITGNVQVVGNIAATGSVLDATGNSNHHSH